MILRFYLPVFLYIIGTVFVISRYRTSWKRLSRNYCFLETFNGERIGIISAVINGRDYNSMLILKYNDQGFYLKGWLPFGLFHPPVMIPWKAVKEIRTKKKFIFRTTQIFIGDPLNAVISVKTSNFEKMESAYNLGIQQNNYSHRNIFTEAKPHNYE